MADERPCGSPATVMEYFYGVAPEDGEQVTFIVGKERVPIKAFKQHISVISLVFNRMIKEIDRSDKPEEQTIILEDDCPVIFQKFVDFVHRPRNMDLSFKQAMKLCHLAHKYESKFVVQAALDYLNLYFDNRHGLEYYECVKKCSDKIQTVMSALRFCCLNLEELLICGMHLDLEMQTLIDIFRLSNICISTEMTLVMALVMYKANRNVDENEMRQVLSYVRFHHLSQTALRESNSIKQLLSEEELKQILLDSPTKYLTSAPRHNYLSSAMCLRITHDQRTVHLNEDSVHFATVTSLKTTRLLGVVIKLAMHQVLPLLDFVITVRQKNHVVMEGRFCLREVKKRPRKCFCTTSHLFKMGTTLEIVLIVKNRVMVTGAFTGRHLHPQYAAFHYDNVDPSADDTSDFVRRPVVPSISSPIHAILSGLILEEIEYEW